MTFLFCLGSIIYLAFIYSFEELPVGFLNYLTLSAYLNVLRVFSEEDEAGETFPIMTVRQNPIKESFKTMVSFEPRKGVCPLPWSKARIHYLRDRRDLLISAPSILVCFDISM